jgi:hypothetical protein
MCSYSYIVPGDAASVEGEGAAVVVVEVDEEEAVVVGVGVVAVDAEADVVVERVDVDVESGVVGTGGCVPFFMFPETATATALYDLIQLRDDTNTAWPSCLMHQEERKRG